MAFILRRPSPFLRRILPVVARNRVEVRRGAVSVGRHRPRRLRHPVLRCARRLGVRDVPGQARAGPRPGGAVLDLSTTALLAAGIGLLVPSCSGSSPRRWPATSAGLAVGVDRRRGPGLARDDADGREPDGEVRRQLGLPTRGDKKGVSRRRPDDALAAARARLRPELVAGIGVVAIVILVWLMEMKPF